MTTIHRLLEKIENAKALDFGTILNESIELFKKTWLQGFLLQVFKIIVILPLIIVVYIPFVGLLIAQQESGYGNTEAFDNFFEGMSVLYILLVIVGVFVLGSIALALQAGFFRIMKKIDFNEDVTTNDFFYFIKSQYLTKALLLLLVTILIAIPAVLLCYLPILYVMVPFAYFTIIFGFNPELNVGDIVKAGFKLGTKKWLISFGLIILTSLMAQIVGFLLCGIGMLLTATFVYHPIYLIYKHVVGFDLFNTDYIVESPVE